MSRAQGARPLHPTAEAILKFVVWFKCQSGGDSPTRREISAELDVPISVVHHHLVMLARAGLVVLSPGGGARRIGIPGAVWTPPQAQLERKDGGKVGERRGAFEGL